VVSLGAGLADSAVASGPSLVLRAGPAGGAGARPAGRAGLLDADTAIGGAAGVVALPFKAPFDPD
jgi:hypothetical protein